MNEVPQNAKINYKVMTGLSNVSQIKSNNDIKQFAEKLIDNLGIDRSNIPVSIKAIPDNGYCRLGKRNTRNKIDFDEYVLNSEETFTESSAHYLIEEYGISAKLFPSYTQ